MLLHPGGNNLLYKYSLENSSFIGKYLEVIPIKKLKMSQQ